jgi:hypothetical protein
MQRFRVTRKKTYQSQNQEKSRWLEVGIITKFDNGNMIMELNDREEVYNIFPIEAERRPQVNTEAQMIEAMGEQPPMPTEEIKVENLPF